MLNEEFGKMLGELGLADLQQVLTETEPETSVRLNPRVTAGLTVAGGDGVAWEPAGFYLNDRPAFTFDPALYQGLYYVQDASSMIVGEAVRRLVERLDPTGAPLKYLDLCAAPGGKTTAALAALPAGSTVVANEYESDRVMALVDNIERWGAADVVVTRSDGATVGRVGETFDIIAADVPCSGEGMMRKNPTAVSQWSPGLVRQCSELQRRIVESAWAALKPGGALIYSTCTFNRAENEDNAEWIRDHLGGIPLDLGLAGFEGVTPGIATDIPVARFIPGRVRGEGLFMAVFVKPGEAGVSPKAGKRDKRRAKGGRSEGSVPAEVAGWITGDRTLLPAGNDAVRAVSPAVAEMAGTMAGSGFAVIRAGVTVATIKGGKPTPTQALATSELLNREAFTAVEVDYQTAIAFLRGEALRLPEGTARGFVVLTYSGRPLGFVKNIGSRANNLLPSGLRIRSANIPATPPVVVVPQAPEPLST